MRTRAGKRVTAARLGSVLWRCQTRIARREEAERISQGMGRAGYGEARLAAQARLLRKRIVLRYMSEEG